MLKKTHSIQLNRTLFYDLLMFALLFVCIYTSKLWDQRYFLFGEPLRLDQFRLFGKVTIYQLFLVIMFIILAAEKLWLNNKNKLLGDVNYLKIIFLIHFFVVIPLLYLTLYIKEIPISGAGIGPAAKYYLYLVVTFYMQDIFLKNKTAHQINNILTALEVLILIRCFWSIGKWSLGYGIKLYTLDRSKLMLAAENDFCDIFLLLLIISLTRYLFNKNESTILKLLHLISIATTTFIFIFSTRRYLWVEMIITYTIILFFYFRYN